MITFDSYQRPTGYSGKLVSFEGIDGSGKTTHLGLLKDWLDKKGYDTLWTEWKNSELCGKALKHGKRKHLMTPLTFTTLQAANIADRLQGEILPALKKGAIVLCDRWFYTCMARDVVRGANPKWVRDVFRFCPPADLVVYFKIDPEVAYQRKIEAEGKVQYYEAGEDLGRWDNRHEGFIGFQTLVNREYAKMVKEFAMVVLDADQDSDAIHSKTLELAKEYLLPDVAKAA